MVRPSVRTVSAWALRWVGCAFLAAIVCVPVAVERAIEGASFEDRLGTLPVQVRLAHNGYTTLDTGLFGKVYYARTSRGGFGVLLRSTGPPVANGTLASYVSPDFVRANTSFLEDPERTAATYGAVLRDQVVHTTVVLTLVGGVAGGAALLLGWSLLSNYSQRTRLVAPALVLISAATISAAISIVEFRSWEGSQTVEANYALPDNATLSFSSPQVREIAEQIRPFIEKNTARIGERSAAYRTVADASLAEQLDMRAAGLAPRSGEVIVLAEADPQGSIVGTRVRRDLYDALEEGLPEGALVLRTIAGDISSNGTVAEEDFVADEAAASPGIPVVAAKGDHDTDTTVQQLIDRGVTVPDTEVVEAAGLNVASARDPAFKALFGGLIVNDTGLTEQDIGASLRRLVDEDDEQAYNVVLHQPRAVAGYLGEDIAAVKDAGTSLTVPSDDGIPDLPPGIVTYGHLHDPAGPWVVWNTDGGAITWTTITQLGTAGGVEENPTFNRFSTPFSTPLKTLSVQLQYLNPDTGLQTGLVQIDIARDGTVTIGDRIDVGLPGGLPGDIDDFR